MLHSKSCIVLSLILKKAQASLGFFFIVLALFALSTILSLVLNFQSIAYINFYDTFEKRYSGIAYLEKEPESHEILFESFFFFLSTILSLV